MHLSVLNLLGEFPNFIALLISAIGTRAVLVFVDLLDTTSNVMRNVLMTVVSGKLRQDLRDAYNYGVGKIEAAVSITCDTVMLLSLALIMGFAVRDLIRPRPAESLLLFALIVKLVNLCGDVFMFLQQRRLCRGADGAMFRSAYSVAVKNLLFDSVSLTALALMNLFSNVKALWYVSPVVSIALGTYLACTTIRRLRDTLREILDKTADEQTQQTILEVLTAHRDQYASYREVRSRVSNGIVFVELELVFAPDTPYAHIKGLTDALADELKQVLPKSALSLRIAGEPRP